MLKATSEKYVKLLESETKHLWKATILRDTSMLFSDYCDFCSFVLTPCGEVIAPFDWFGVEKIIKILGGK